MIVRVVMSRATRAPATSLSLFTLFLHPTTYRGPLLALTITVRGGKTGVRREGSKRASFRGGGCLHFSLSS